MCEVQGEEQRRLEKYEEETIGRRWHLFVYVIIWFRFASTIISTFRWLISNIKNFPNLRNNVICKQKRTQYHRTHPSDPTHLSRLQGRLSETKIIGKKTTLRNFQSSTTCLFFFLFRLSLCPTFNGKTLAFRDLATLEGEDNRLPRNVGMRTPNDVESYSRSMESSAVRFL